MKSGKINEQPLIGGECSEQRRTWEILRCLFGRVFDAIFELHLMVNREWLQFLWQGKWPVKKKTHKHVLGWLVWQQRAEWTCEKRNWRQRVCGQIRGDQSLRQKGKEAECGLSHSDSLVISESGFWPSKDLFIWTFKVTKFLRAEEDFQDSRLLIP